MASLRLLSSLPRLPRTTTTLCRALHSSPTWRKISEFNMPAMSPTMTTGSISRWNVKEGDSFSAGDVIVVVETDKAEVDVEAQDDGVMGKIILGDGSKDIDVGKPIALLAEEGDDISNLEAPKQSSSSSDSAKSETKSKGDEKPSSESQPTSSSSESASTSPKGGSESAPPQKSSSDSHSHGTPKHPHPLFPSVLRLLAQNGISDASDFKGTGHKGMLTKGDVLAKLGKVKDPLGSFRKLAKEHGAKEGQQTPSKAGGASQKKPPPKPLDGPSARRLIASGLSDPSPLTILHDVPASTRPGADFDEILSGYFPSLDKAKSTGGKATGVPPPPQKTDVWSELLQ